MLLYSLPGDNIASEATIAVDASATEDTEYPAANLTNLNPAKPGKIQEVSGGWVFDFGGAVSIELFALIHHNLDPGLQVRLQGNAADAWGAPTFNQLLTIPAYHEDGFPVSPWMDLTAVAHSFQFWRLIVVGANSAPVAVGEVVFSIAKRELPSHLAPGFADVEDHPVVEHRTDLGVSTVYDLGTKWRTWVGELPVLTDAGVDALRALVRGARGRGRGFLLIPEHTENDAWFVRLGESRQAVYRYLLNVNRLPVTFEEVSRGLPL